MIKKSMQKVQGIRLMDNLKKVDLKLSEKPRSDMIVDSILKYIRDNDLKPGDRLPSERALAERFGVNRATLREAARILSIVNIIEIRQQGGMFVAKPGSSSRFDYFKLCMQSGQISMAEIFETRLIMEVECIALAAANITDEQLDALEGIISSVSIYDPTGFAKADEALHGIIYAATGNRALQLLMQTVSMWTVVSRKFSNSFEDVRRIVHSDHEAIYLALRNRDVERCRECMRQHILHLQKIQDIQDTMLKAEFAKLRQDADLAANP